jgi:hypothetical protein
VVLLEGKEECIGEEGTTRFEQGELEGEVFFGWSDVSGGEEGGEVLGVKVGYWWNEGKEGRREGRREGAEQGEQGSEECGELGVGRSGVGVGEVGEGLLYECR